jgi:hypothetical protein
MGLTWSKLQLRIQHLPGDRHDRHDSSMAADGIKFGINLQKERVNNQVSFTILNRIPSEKNVEILKVFLILS